MPYRDEAWPAGTPCWIDLAVDDAQAAREFYTALFGWDVHDGPAEAGGYLMALKDGRPAAGMMGKPPEMAQMPSAWSMYFAVEDVDKSLAAVTDAGGSVAVGAMDVMDVGRMAFALDPAGAGFGLWQARAHHGVGVFNEPGSVCWNELHTRDYAAALEFYSTVFGFLTHDIGMEGMEYSTFTLAEGGDDVGGMHHDTDLPEGVPPYWLVWFAVGDCDAAAARATELGSTLMMPPADTPFGKMAVAQGPQGEVFGIIDMATTVGAPPSV